MHRIDAKSVAESKILQNILKSHKLQYVKKNAIDNLNNLFATKISARGFLNPQGAKTGACYVSS